MSKRSSANISRCFAMAEMTNANRAAIVIAAGKCRSSPSDSPGSSQKSDPRETNWIRRNLRRSTLHAHQPLIPKPSGLTESRHNKTSVRLKRKSQCADFRCSFRKERSKRRDDARSPSCPITANRSNPVASARSITSCARATPKPTRGVSAETSSAFGLEKFPQDFRTRTRRRGRVVSY
jgi:hypothetical protein